VLDAPLPWGVAVDSDMLYWIQYTSGYELRRMPIASPTPTPRGGTRELLATGDDLGFSRTVFAGDSIYWFDSLRGDLQRMLKIGGPAELVYHGPGSVVERGARLAIADGYAYIYDSNRTLYRVSMQDWTGQVLVRNVDVAGLHAENDAVYFIVSRDGVYRLTRAAMDAFDGGAVVATDAAAATTDAAVDEMVTPPSASARVLGMYQGASFDARGGGLHRFYWAEPDAGTVTTDVHSGVSIMITQYANACTAPRDTSKPVLAFYLRSGDRELGPGTFPIVDSFVAGGQGPAPQGTANVFGLDAADCGVHNFDQGASGSVTLTAVAPERVEGTFDVTFNASGSFSGRFSLLDCRGVVSLDDSDPTLKCVL
jgi:hypothetical protein